MPDRGAQDPGRENESAGVAAPGPAQVVAVVDAEPNDDAPTVISKMSPAQAVKSMIGGANFGQDLKGRTLAHFELLEPIGVGGMAAVLRARDQQLDRCVALKILPPEMSSDPENVQRFHQEARAAAKLDHENIARVFYCGEDQHLHFIAFEFVEGENLRAILERRGRIPVAEAVRYVLQIATGLEHAASRGVVHRDIKPSNIIITPTGRAKLVDMGLARSLAPHDDKALTHSGVTLGTFDYISPEQALEPREADVRSDIYSLGCTFYHMITGQPPVPGGTAAKKLHHHQNVDPVDPRQLNPDVPDDVAAILARMIAKDPKKRYQRPVHLIQHLMQVAQQVGAAADTPEGVLFVDTPLPNAPRKRPLLTVAMAALGLALVLFLLSLAPTSKTPTLPPSSVAREPSLPAGPDKPGVETVTTKSPWRIKEVKDIEPLRQMLAHPQSPQVRVVVEMPVLDLTDGPLVFSGNELVLESADAKAPATIKLRYQPGGDETATRAALWIESGKAFCKNLRFEVESALTPEVAVAAVVVSRSATALFNRCTFVQKGFPEQALIPLRAKYVPLASLALDNQGADKNSPAVGASECYFEAGQDAIVLNGPGDLDLSNCAFGPHGALVHLRGKSEGQESKIVWKHCSAFLVNGPGFRLDDEAVCRLQIDYCIFSTPPDLLLNFRDDLALIRQTDARRPIVRLFSKRNCFHNLNVLWAWPQENGSKVVSQPDDFKNWIVKAGGAPEPLREASFFLTGATNPWRSPKPLQQADDRRFEVSDLLAEVRKDRDTPLGIQRCVWGSMPALLPLPETLVAGPDLQPREKLVDPDTPGNVPNVYKNFAQALTHAEPGDVILIKHAKSSRQVAIKPALLEQAKIDLTLKPYKGYQPILTLAETPEPNAAMFRLYDGRLRLEGLEVLLSPAQAGFKSQSVIALHGNGRCSFKHCLVTLKEIDQVPLRVVSLENPENAMKMANKLPRPSPEIRFQDCFVRGEGDLVRFMVSRPSDVNIDNSLLGLSGSLAVMAGNGKEPAIDHAAHIKLSRVSAFLADPLVQLKAAAAGKGLVPTRLEAKDSLFVALAGKPLIYLDGLDVDDNRLRELFNWTAGAHNAYSGFERYLDQQRLDEIVPLPTIRYDEKSWRMYSMEEDSKYLAVLPVTMRPLSQATIDDFKAARGAAQNFGANLDAAQLPMPPRLNSVEPDAPDPAER